MKNNKIRVLVAAMILALTTASVIGCTPANTSTNTEQKQEKQKEGENTETNSSTSDEKDSKNSSENNVEKTVENKDASKDKNVVMVDKKKEEKSSSKKAIIIYYTYDINTEALNENKTYADEVSVGNVIKELVNNKVLQSGTAVNTAKVTNINGVRTLVVDVNSKFINFNQGSSAEMLSLRSFANSLIKTFHVSQVKLTVDGANYSGGHIALKDGQYLKFK